MNFTTFDETENPFLEGLTQYLLDLKFPKKKCGKNAKGKQLNRANIVNQAKDKEVECIILGKVRCFNKAELVNSTMTRKHEDLFEVLQDLIAYSHPEFKYTSICINKNVITGWHRDKNNTGESMCISLGNQLGGGIALDLEDGTVLEVNNKNTFLLYDGSKITHKTIAPEYGNRIAIIYYTANEYNKKC